MIRSGANLETWIMCFEAREPGGMDFWEKGRRNEEKLRALFFQKPAQTVCIFLFQFWKLRYAPRILEKRFDDGKVTVRRIGLSGIKSCAQFADFGQLFGRLCPREYRNGKFPAPGLPSFLPETSEPFLLARLRSITTRLGRVAPIYLASRRK